MNDEKIEAMRALYGNDGYAFYFILLERIYKKNGVLDVKNPAIISAIKRNVTANSELFDKMLNTAFEIGLFDKCAFDEKGIITSTAIECRTTSVNNERARKRAYAESKRVLDGENTANRRKLPPKVKQSKVKESKENNNTPIAPKGASEPTTINQFIKSLPYSESFKSAFHGFAEMRRTIKHPITVRAAQMILNNLNKLSDTEQGKIDILNQSIEHSWQGVFEVKGNVQSKQPQHYSPGFLEEL